MAFGKKDTKNNDFGKAWNQVDEQAGRMMTIMIRVSLHINTTFLYKISTNIDTSNGKQDRLLVLIIKPTS